MSSISVGWDSDDVLIDKFPYRTRRIQETARRMKLRVPSAEEIAEDYGYLEKTVPRLFPDVDTDKFIGLYYSENFYYPLLEGVREAIAYLTSRNIPMWIFSGRRIEELRSEARLAGLDLNRFYPVIGLEETNPHKKPEPESWDICAQRLKEINIDPQKSFYIDDFVQNYLRARGHGFMALLLLGSPNSKGYEMRVDKNDVLKSLYEFPALFEKRISEIGE